MGKIRIGKNFGRVEKQVAGRHYWLAPNNFPGIWLGLWYSRSASRFDGRLRLRQFPSVFYNVDNSYIQGFAQ